MSNIEPLLSSFLLPMYIAPPKPTPASADPMDPVHSGLLTNSSLDLNKLCLLSGTSLVKNLAPLANEPSSPSLAVFISTCQEFSMFLKLFVKLFICTLFAVSAACVPVIDALKESALSIWLSIAVKATLSRTSIPLEASAKP